MGAGSKGFFQLKIPFHSEKYPGRSLCSRSLPLLPLPFFGENETALLCKGGAIVALLEFVRGLGMRKCTSLT